MNDPTLLETVLDGHRVIARPGPQRGRSLWVLDPLAAEVWDATRAGLSLEEIAAQLAARASVAPEQVQADIERLTADWPEARTAGCEWTLGLTDRLIALRVEDVALATELEPLLAHLRMDAGRGPDAQLSLTGTAAAWQLYEGSALSVAGESPDAAVSHTLALLAEVACATDERLLVLHAAAVCRASGADALVLMAPGGSGKTTLATALSADGWSLLGDDVIPVTPDGQLLGPGLGPCLKAGSWAVLSGCQPDLGGAPVRQRGGQAVRFVPPPGPIARGPVSAAAFLVPRYRPGSEPLCAPLTAVEVLREMIAAEAVLPFLDQPKLDALIGWIETAPGFALDYPDLASAVEMVSAIVG